MAPTPAPKSLLRAIIGVVSLLCSLVIIPIGFVLLIADSQGGSDQIGRAHD